MKTSIVITTIQYPTEAVKTFSKLVKHDCDLIIVGDLKTPADWFLPQAKYTSFDNQDKLVYKITKLLPKNHYSRKMIGYLLAISEDADVIVDTDDDNIPYPNWGFPSFSGLFPCLIDNNGFTNIYSYYTQQKIWPRGFPLQKVNENNRIIKNRDIQQNQVEIGIWQGLADEDPDVDAIYRLIINTPCYFAKNGQLVLGKNTVCPFNSQNTAFRRAVFPLLYLPTTVTFRFTDILRGIIAQPILWHAGYHLGFTDPTVVQKRNEHDYLRDFESEIPCYLKIEEIFNLAKSVASGSNSISDNLFAIYCSLQKTKLVETKELDILECWLSDCQKYS
jgi:hypothetical protein